MRRIVGTIVGKSVAATAKLRSKTGGHALPGLVVDRLIPSYLTAMLRQLPEGVIIITGTNGKTTTTKMVVELLQANGKRVLTNPTGSNMTRGIVSILTREATVGGKLPFDLAVLELDEAYAQQLAEQLPPRWVLALNVSRDQLDRFGEVDVIANYITATMARATEGVITNADDQRLSRYAETSLATAGKRVEYFGVNRALLKFFPRDNELVEVVTGTPDKLPELSHRPLAELLRFADSNAVYEIAGQEYPVSLQVTGQHNFQNAAAALALTTCLLPELSVTKLITQIGQIKTAFGRGQTFHVAGNTIQLALVKNPAGFRQNLASYVDADSTVMIAINDNIADSRDLSWLWDVDFSSLSLSHGVAITSGRRAVDMALRLSYDDIAVTTVEPDIKQALQQFIKLPATKKVILASYTAMLRLHTLLIQQEASK